MIYFRKVWLWPHQIEHIKDLERKKEQEPVRKLPDFPPDIKFLYRVISDSSYFWYLYTKSEGNERLFIEYHKEDRRRFGLKYKTLIRPKQEVLPI